MKRRRAEFGLLLIALMAVIAGLLGASDPAGQVIDTPATRPDAELRDAYSRLKPAVISVPIDGRDRRVEIRPTPEGIRARLETGEGVKEYSGEEFLTLMYGQQQKKERHWYFRLFNITSWRGFFWVSLGLFGQLLFTFRMVLQWLASEKHGKSVVPVGFWWGSLIGGLMLLTYFIWRKDIVGILGQSTGAFIYARNLVLIYRERGRIAGEFATDEHR